MKNWNAKVWHPTVLAQKAQFIFRIEMRLLIISGYCFVHPFPSSICVPAITIIEFFLHFFVLKVLFFCSSCGNSTFITDLLVHTSYAVFTENFLCSSVLSTSV